MRAKFLLLFICSLLESRAVVCSGSLTALQMAATDLKKVQHYYEANPSITVNTYYMAFDAHKSPDIKEGKYGLMIKNKTSCYTKILHIESLNAQDLTINVDHEDKLIVIGDNNPVLSNPFSERLDSLLLFCTAVEYTQLSSTERKYTLDFSDNDFSEYDKLEITIDVKNYRFNKIGLFFRASMNLSGDYNGEEKPPRLEIAYKNYKATVSDPALLDKNSFLTEKDGSIRPALKYKNYKVMDLRKKSRIKGYKKQ